MFYGWTGKIPDSLVEANRTSVKVMQYLGEITISGPFPYQAAPENGDKPPQRQI